jgi:hypothetical protein
MNSFGQRGRSIDMSVSEKVLILLKKTLIKDPSFFAAVSWKQSCPTRAWECEEKIPDRVVQTSYNVVANITRPATSSESEPRMVDRMA